MGAGLIAIALLGACFASLYGWGRLTLPLLYREPPRSPAFATALGLAIWTFLGGLLNATGLAYALALDGLFLSGLLLFLGLLFKSLAARGAGLAPGSVWKQALAGVVEGRQLGDLAPIGVVLLVGVYLIATVLPADAFNYHDDLRSYFVPPLRMLATGSMSAGAFDLLGPSRFGPQEFFLAFVFAHFPPAYANAFDLVFCLVLSGLLVNAFGQRLGLHWGYRLAAVLGMLCIHPQYVNVSSLYSATAMLLALLYASLILVERSEAQALGERLGALVPVACFAGTSLLFKATVAPFTVGFLILLLLWLALLSRSVRRIVSLAGGLTAFTGMFVLPWVLALQADYTALGNKVVRALSRVVEGSLGSGPLSTASTASGGAPATVTGNLARIFSLDPLFWGGSFPLYTGAVLFVTVIAVVALVRSRPGPSGARQAALGVCAAAGVAAGGSYLAGAFVYLERPDLVVRYFLPVLIGILPAVFLLLLSGLPEKRRPDSRVPALPAILLVLGLGGVSLGFAGTLLDRARQLYADHSMLSFPIDANYIKYNQIALSDITRQRLAELQTATEPGGRILAWISLPFDLDYGRNPIVALDAAGLPKLGLDMRLSAPFDVEPERIREHLLERGIRYVMWQYRGSGMRSDRALAARGWCGVIGLKRRLEQLARESAIVANRYGILVFDLAHRPPPRSSPPPAPGPDKR